MTIPSVTLAHSPAWQQVKRRRFRAPEVHVMLQAGILHQGATDILG